MRSSTRGRRRRMRKRRDRTLGVGLGVVAMLRAMKPILPCHTTTKGMETAENSSYDRHDRLDEWYNSGTDIEATMSGAGS